MADYIKRSSSFGVLNYPNNVCLGYPEAKASFKPELGLGDKSDLLVLPANNESSDALILPFSTWEDTADFVMELSVSGAKEAVSLASDYSGLLKNAAQQMANTQRRIINEYISVNHPTEEHFRRWFKDWSINRNVALDPLVNKFVGLTKVQVIDESMYHRFMSEYALIESMPDSPRKLQKIKAFTRKLGFLPKDKIKNTLRISKLIHKRLSKATGALAVIGFIDPGVRIATANTYEEFKKAVADTAKEAASFFASSAATLLAKVATYKLALLIGLTPAGWIVLSVGLIAGVVTGFYFGEYVENLTLTNMPDLQGKIPLP